MLKRILTLTILILLNSCAAFASCATKSVAPLEKIETNLKQQTKTINIPIYYTKTLTGLAISIKNEYLFDEHNCLKPNGKIFLDIMAITMKTSGRKWMILTHTLNGNTQIDKIANTSLKANIITSYLTDKEGCLINQIFPIGFGSIIPPQTEKSKRHEMYERTDFIIEDFKLNLQ